MNYADYYNDLEDVIKERIMLSRDRIERMNEEICCGKRYEEYLTWAAAYFADIYRIVDRLIEDNLESASEEELRDIYRRFYRDYYEDYDSSYANPNVVTALYGEKMGRIISVFTYELRMLIKYAFSGRFFNILIFSELFILIYNCFEEEEEPNTRELRMLIYWFISDYADVLLREHIHESVCTEELTREIVNKIASGESRYKYYYGEYVTESYLRNNAYSRDRLKNDIDAISCGLTREDTVNISYHIGNEAYVRELEKALLDKGIGVIYTRKDTSLVSSTYKERWGYRGYENMQAVYDHMNDIGLFLDKKLFERRIEVIKTSLSEYAAEYNRLKKIVILSYKSNSFRGMSRKENSVILTDKQYSYNMEYEINELKRRYSTAFESDELLLL